MPASKFRLGTRGRPAESRAAILQAAVREFAHEGPGARIDAIAALAGVNKACSITTSKIKKHSIALCSIRYSEAFGPLSTTRYRKNFLRAQNLPAMCARISITLLRIHSIRESCRRSFCVRDTEIRHACGGSQKQYFPTGFSRYLGGAERRSQSGDYSARWTNHFVPSMISCDRLHFNTAEISRKTGRKYCFAIRRKRDGSPCPARRNSACTIRG